MAEEFQESEVIFSDNNSCYDFQEMIVCPIDANFLASNNKSPNNTSKNKKNLSSSLPVNIPQSFFQFGKRDSVENDGNNDDDGELVPPHVIVGRRIAGKMAFSMCTGNGRTLKGRDLSQVRNSILKMTGFLET